MAMFDLPGADSTSMKSVFVPPFPKVDTDAMDMNEPISEIGSEFIETVVSLGGSETVLQSKWVPPENLTPAKRKLDVEFLAIQVIRSVSGVKSKDVEVDDHEGSGCGLDAVNLEED